MTESTDTDGRELFQQLVAAIEDVTPAEGLEAGMPGGGGGIGHNGPPPDDPVPPEPKDDGRARVRAAFAAAEDVTPAPGLDGGLRDPFDEIMPVKADPAAPKGPPAGAPDPSQLPPGFPVMPLGHAAGTYHFLTARGEMLAIPVATLATRSALVALFSGADRAEDWLAWIGPQGARDIGFSPVHAADFLITACARLPLFDGSLRVQRRGTWRGPGGSIVAHLGDRVDTGGEMRDAGLVLGGAVYPAGPPCPAPASSACDVGDLRAIRDELRDLWGWQRPEDADIFMGAVAQGALGHFPAWRAHLWLQGRSGAGKSTLISLASHLLGGMSDGVREDATEAALRQSASDKALVHIFDEAEATGEFGHVERLIGLLRLTSGPDGARIDRGSTGGKATSFWMYGAGIFGSINPGMMRPQDRSRFVMLHLGPLPKADDPLASAMRLSDLEASARFYGPHLWRRMLDQAPGRWDATVRRYSALVQAQGGDRRAAATISAVLAGWDLLLHDGDLKEDPERLAQASAMAGVLLTDVAEAEAEGEGERCLRRLLACPVPKDHGGMAQVSELVAWLQDKAGQPSTSDSDQRLLARCGLRVLSGEPGKRDLFVSNGEWPILDRAFSGTPWRAGGHRAALLALDGAHPSKHPVRVGGKKERGILIDGAHLPRLST